MSTPTRDEIKEHNKFQWLRVNETNEFINSLKEARNKLLLEAEELSSSTGGVDIEILVKTKLVQSKTIRQIIDYAQKTDASKFTP